MQYTLWHFYIAFFAELLTIPIGITIVFFLHLMLGEKEYPKRTHYITYTLLILLPIVQNILRSLT